MLRRRHIHQSLCRFRPFSHNTFVRRQSEPPKLGFGAGCPRVSTRVMACPFVSGGGGYPHLDQHPLLRLLQPAALVAKELVLPVQHLRPRTHGHPRTDTRRVRPRRRLRGAGAWQVLRASREKTKETKEKLASTPEKCLRQAEMLLLCSSSRERSRKDSSREVTWRGSVGGPFGGPLGRGWGGGDRGRRECVVGGAGRKAMPGGMRARSAQQGKGKRVRRPWTVRTRGTRRRKRLRGARRAPSHTTGSVSGSPTSPGKSRGPRFWTDGPVRGVSGGRRRSQAGRTCEGGAGERGRGDGGRTG